MNKTHSNKPVKIKKHETQSLKTKFRRTVKWKKFRDKKRKEQKNDYITEKPLSKTYNLHHLDLNSEHYENITNEDNFIGLNSLSHVVIHFFYGEEKTKKNWKRMVLKLIEILKRMDKLNSYK